MTTTYIPGVLATDVYIGEYGSETFLAAGSRPTEEQAAQITNPKLWAELPSTGLPEAPTRERTLEDLALHSRAAGIVLGVVQEDEDNIMRDALREFLGLS